MDNHRQFAIELAHDAGRIVMQHYGKIQQLEWKLSTNFKTAVDDEIDQLIRQRIAKYFPDHSIYSEELEPSKQRSAYSWVIDPLDGTLPYAYGISDHFGVSIALTRDSQPILGVYYAPARAELYVGQKEQRAWRNDAPVHVAELNDPNKALLGLDYGKVDRGAILSLQQKLLGPDGVSYTFAHGSAATSLALVAAGRLHGYLALKLEPWDMAAGVILIREAGGKVTDINGKEWELGDESILAANPALHAKLLDLLR